MDTAQPVTVIDRAKAAEYLLLHGEISTKTKRLEELKKELLPQLAAGAASPRDLPFLLVNRPQSKPQKDWPAYVRGLLLKLYRRAKDPEAKAAGELARIEAAWPKKDTPSLVVTLNPEFMQQGETKTA